MKRKIALVLALLMMLSVLTACGSGKTWTGKHEVEIVVKNYGTIRLEIDGTARRKRPRSSSISPKRASTTI